MAKIDKKELRKYVRRAKKTYTEAELVELSHVICRTLAEHPRVMNAETLLLYWPLPDEVRCDELVMSLVSKGKEVLLPKVVSDTEMTIHRFTSVDDMAVGAYGILEPIGERVDNLSDESAEAMQSGHQMVAIVPGMAFDKHGHRLGRGKGYYDRFLSHVPDIYKIGVCFPFQMVEEVPCGEYDVMMNEVVSR